VDQSSSIRRLGDRVMVACRPAAREPAARRTAGLGGLPSEILQGLLMETAAPLGRITHLRPVLEMSEAPPR